MSRYLNYLSLLLINLFISTYSSAQKLDSLPLKWEADIASTCAENTMTMQEDRLDRDFLYVAAKEGGLKIYNIKDLSKSQLVKQYKKSDLDNQAVMNVHQNGNYLYLSLGDFFSGKEAPGLAIIDVTDPGNPSLKDIWKFGTATEGTGMIVTHGDYAYMAAMAHGLIILNIADKDNIQFESQLVPDLDFPQKNADLTKINARGLQYRDGLIYLSYDAGGVRIIDVSDPKKPKERGKYSNPQLNGKPRAYNNVVLDSHRLFVTFDYCGLEVLDIRDTASMKLINWWNPWGCPNNNWFTSTGHTNEIAIDTSCELIFMSTGKSELYVLDISNPDLPDSLTSFGATDNKLGTWGVSNYRNKIYLSYICTLGIPFQSNWSGVKALSYKACKSTGSAAKPFSRIVRFYPQPVRDKLKLDPLYQNGTIKIFNLRGQKMLDQETSTDISIRSLAAGIYVVQIEKGEQLFRGKLLVGQP